MGKIENYQKVDTLGPADLFLVDKEGRGTKTIRTDNMAFALMDQIPSAHIHFFRGKHLGDRLTAEQKLAIAGGTFVDLWVGDYWTINGVNWRIADFDYFYKLGYPSPLNTHHAVIVPDQALLTNISMHNVGGDVAYASTMIRGSRVHGTCRQLANQAFPDALVEFSDSIVTRLDDWGVPAQVTWYKTWIELMTCDMVFGNSGNSVRAYGNYSVEQNSASNRQLSLFKLSSPHMVIPNDAYWLRDHTGHRSEFSAMGVGGDVTSTHQTATRSVRPFFLIG